MAFLAVNKNGQEVIFINKPKGSIEKLTGRKLTWNNNPLKLKENETV